MQGNVYPQRTALTGGLLLTVCGRPTDGVTGPFVGAGMGFG